MLDIFNFCQQLIQPCETDACRYAIFAGIGLLLVISVISFFGMASGEYHRREAEKFKNVFKIRRKK